MKKMSYSNPGWYDRTLPNPQQNTQLPPAPEGSVVGFIFSSSTDKRGLALFRVTKGKLDMMWHPNINGGSAIAAAAYLISKGVGKVYTVQQPTARVSGDEFMGHPLSFADRGIAWQYEQLGELSVQGERLREAGIAIETLSVPKPEPTRRIGYYWQ
jgi:hypothetical protein